MRQGTPSCCVQKRFTGRSGWNRFNALAEEEEEDDCEKDETEGRARMEYEVNAVVKDNANEGVMKGKGIQPVWADLGVGDITVDSAADESCWPKDLGGAFPTKPSKKNIVLKTANGGEMGHYGEKDVTFKDTADGDIVGLKFQVTDVRKPLLAVRRLVERGRWLSSNLSRRTTTSSMSTAAGRS